VHTVITLVLHHYIIATIIFIIALIPLGFVPTGNFYPSTWIEWYKDRFNRTEEERREDALGFVDQYQNLQKKAAARKRAADGIPEPKTPHEEMAEQLANLEPSDTALGFVKILRDRLDTNSVLYESLTRVLETKNEAEAKEWLVTRAHRFSPPIRDAINSAVVGFLKSPSFE